jgi:hypothetical protein
VVPRCWDGSGNTTTVLAMESPFPGLIAFI